jgi:hypothetical protein
VRSVGGANNFQRFPSIDGNNDDTLNTRRSRPTFPGRVPGATSTTRLHVQKQNQQQDAEDPVVNIGDNDDVIVVMDWECVVDTTPLYIKLGIEAAFTVWPDELRQLIDQDDDDLTWLINKLQAISHVLVAPSSSSSSSSSFNYHPACEYALATRLILEEQVLDQNQSTGLNGKYARRFHPRQELKTTLNATASTSPSPISSPTSSSPSSPSVRPSSKRGTRPLTVGELVANWRDSIRETLTLKYNVKKQDPMPILDRTIVELLQQDQDKQQDEDRPKLFPDLKFALTHSNRPVMVTCRHPCDADILRQGLEESNIPFQVIDQSLLALDEGDDGSKRNRCDFESLAFLTRKKAGKNGGFGSTPTAASSSNAMNQSSCRPILVVTPKLPQSTSSPSSSSFLLPDVIRRTMCGVDNEDDSDDDRSVVVVYVDAVWYRLVEDAVPLFGDYIPRHGSNIAICGGVEPMRQPVSSSSLRRPPENVEDADEEPSRTSSSLARGTATTRRGSTTRMSLYLAEWVSSSSSSSSSVLSASLLSPDRTGSSTSQHNIEALANPWTLPISWHDFERRFLSYGTDGSGDNPAAFQ